MLEVLIHQIKDQLKNLKFLISFLLILFLFILNAFFFSYDYQKKRDMYTKLRYENSEIISKASEGLNQLVFLEQEIVKEPLSYEFIAGNKQNYFPNSLSVSISAISLPKKVGNEFESNDIILMDWLFIIAIIGTFLIFILTFDAITQEREKGTLKLVFSNSISNLSFIYGKLLGIVLAFVTSVFIGLVLNIIIISFINKIPIGADLLGRIGILFILCSVFVFLFATIGLLVSFVSKNSLRSLIVLTLIWIVLAFITPVFSRIATSAIYEVESLTEFEHKYKHEETKFPELILKHNGARRGIQGGRIDNYQREKGMAAAMTELARNKQGVQDKYLNDKINQANFYNSLCKISPIYLFQYMVEDLFNSGVKRDVRFFDQVKKYQSQLTAFYKEEDSKDEKSPHVYFMEGYFSAKSVDLGQYPKFQEARLSAMDSLADGLSGFLIILIELIALLAFLSVIFSRGSIV